MKHVEIVRRRYRELISLIWEQSMADMVSETEAIEKIKRGRKQASERENAWTIKPLITRSCDPN